MSGLQPQNFSMLAGDSKILKITVVDEATGEPMPLAGTTAVSWRLGRTARSAPVLSKTLGNGATIILTEAAAGQANCGRIDVRIDSADSEDLSGEYFHDCQIFDGTGARATIFYGRANITPNLN